MDFAESPYTSSGEAEASTTEASPYEMETFQERPLIKSVTVPQTVKRRVPIKHYVYKVVVQWTDRKEIIIYRKYSFFFDFVVKLNELVAQLSPEEVKSVTMQLPELPGRVLFGRSEVHQVAEKRRKKIEEFCQKLIDLPPEVSQSNLVLGFFNTWPDDTMLRKPSVRNTHVISAPVIPPARPHSPNDVSPIVRHSSLTSSQLSTAMALERSASPSPPPPVTSPLSPLSPTSDSAIDAIISHPDEMESLEQYRVLANYERKDAHQVSLLAGQLVHVIEKHDTGWWMVMSDDEQGYAPASYLEPLEESSSVQDVHPEDMTNQVYEAMESYFAENDDEITMKAGDRVDVISKSMDGWWKIRCNGVVGYSPAALIRRKNSLVDEEEHVYESEKSIYEGLNIHRPPPRRNTIDRTALSKVHKVPVNYKKPQASKNNSIYVDSPEGESDEDTPKCYQVANSNGMRKPLVVKGKGTGPVRASSLDFLKDEHVYEMEPPLYEFDEENGTDDGSVYENTEFPPRDISARKGSSPAVLSAAAAGFAQSSKQPHLPGARTQSTSAVMVARRGRHTPDDYEDPDALLDGMEGDRDYVDMDSSSHNTYIDPEDLRRVSSCSSATASSGSFTSNKRPDSTSSTPSSTKRPDSTSSTPSSTKRPDSTSSTPGTTVVSPKLNGSSHHPAEPVFDDDYIVMDPLYVVPPEDDPLYVEPPSAEDLTDGDSDTLKAGKTTPPKTSPVSIRPLPPPPYAGRESPSGEKILTRVKSLEDLIATFSPDGKPPIKPRSPEMKHKPNPSPPPRVKSPLGKQQSVESALSRGKPQLPSRNKPSQGSVNGVMDALSKGNHPLARSTSPPNGSAGTPPRKDRVPHHPLEHTVSSPNLDAVLPKTYVSMSGYTSESEQCLSFNAGDKCVLIQQNNGWWLVNIGGREGWTPGEYWKEDIKRDVNLPKPPSFAPQKLQNLRKPRSHTVATESVSSSVEFPLSEWKKEEKSEEKPSALCSSLSMGSVLPGKPKGPLPKIPPPQKMKPLKPPKPVVPVKPDIKAKNSKTSRDSVSPSSPPTNRKKTTNHSPSPPPLPPPNQNKKALNSEQVSQSASEVNGHTPGNAPCTTLNEYEHLNDVSTAVIDTSPWFAGKMERGQAEQFLMDHGRQREFLIRERTTKDGYYALSVRYHYSCKHFNIDPSSNGQYTMGTLSFPSIDNVIQHYQQNSLFIHDGQHVTLSQPVKKRARPSDANRHAPSPHS